MYFSICSIVFKILRYVRIVKRFGFYVDVCIATRILQFTRINNRILVFEADKSECLTLRFNRIREHAIILMIFFFFIIYIIFFRYPNVTFSDSGILLLECVRVWHYIFVPVFARLHHMTFIDNNTTGQLAAFGQITRAVVIRVGLFIVIFLLIIEIEILTVFIVFLFLLIIIFIFILIFIFM